MPLTALISDPERKKQRSDANADAREIYITGLSRFAAAKDLNRLFDPVRRTYYQSRFASDRAYFDQFGEIKRINIATDDEGHCKGFAFIEFAEEVGLQ
jgi:RNA recognition motif-containing protein